MGSKKLKAIAVKGAMKVPVVDEVMVKTLLREHVAQMREDSFLEQQHKYGTGGQADISAHNGNIPVKNWGEVLGLLIYPMCRGSVAMR